MKILFFLESYRAGGVDSFVANLVNFWPIATDELVLVCNHTNSGLEVLNSRIKRNCTITVHRVRTFMYFFDRGTMNKNSCFIRLLRLFSPILRYIFILYNSIALRSVLAAHDPDNLMVINGGYPGGDSCRAACIAWGFLGKKRLAIHNFHGIVLPAHFYNMIQEYLVDILVRRNTRCFVTVSKAARNTMSCRKAIYTKAAVKYIYNGIGVPEARSRENSRDLKRDLRISPNSLICLMLGGYTYNENFDKGHSFLLTVFKEVIKNIPDVHLVMCGQGTRDEIDAVRNKAVALGLDRNVHLLGFHVDAASLIEQSDLMVLGSQTFESFGLVAVEAMAHQIPVVATRVGALPEVIREGEGGFCVDKYDVVAYAKTVIALLCDSDLRRQQGSKGYQRFVTNFNVDRMVREYARLIHDG